jgi:DNA-binding winged helix-turn-helix (wHTH) protein
VFLIAYRIDRPALAEASHFANKARKVPLGGELIAGSRRIIWEVTGMETTNGRIVRFGVFEADLATGQLRKSGLKIKLQDQPFQILTILLERPGEVITREEFRSRLWPGGSFVDFDHGLNASMNKLREALGDAAAHGRFIETVPRRGYRFVAPAAPPANPARLSGTGALAGRRRGCPVAARLSIRRVRITGTTFGGYLLSLDPRRGSCRSLSKELSR